jgi:tRNA nucleotidyltransferase (CCA-adding enzyme)
MAVDLNSGKLIDPYGGAEDIANHTLRAHNPDALKEDPLRVVRALAANSRFGLTPDTATREQMAANAGTLQHLPGERIQAELDKLFAGKNPAQAIRFAHETGVLGQFMPEVEDAFGYDQNNPHHELELGDHLTKVLERTAQKSDDPDLRLAGLLHDIGKPASAWVDPEYGTNHYYEKHMPDGTVLGANHEDVGAEQARALMNRLRYPNDRIDRVSELIQHHMWPAFTTPRGARKFLHRVGDHADDLLKLRWADQGGKGEYPTDPNLSLEIQEKLINQIRNQGQATNKAQLAINGRDLIEAGVPQGPQIGEILKQLTEAVVENPALNNREQLLTLAQQSAKLSSNGGQNEEEGSSPSPEADGWPVHAEALRQAAEDEQEAGLEEPYFPEVDDAIEANQVAHENFTSSPSGTGSVTLAV